MLKFCHTVPSLRGALLGYTSNRLMLTNLACPWGYTTVQRLHHRQTRSLGTKGWKDASECNNGMIAQCAIFYKKIWILEWREKRFPFESSFWISLSGCKLIILPYIQPANRIVIISALHLYPLQTREQTKKELPNSYIKLLTCRQLIVRFSQKTRAWSRSKSL